MNYNEFLKTIDQVSANFSWRYGQALMNVLHGVWPEKYNEITESEFDPYYTDKYVSYILNILKENWNPTEENLI
jgi:hypothetical protein